MCGRLLSSDPAELVDGWSETRILPSLDELRQLRHYNVAPSQTVLVLREQARGREIAAVRWGLIPAWAKDESIGSKMFNARAETLAEKPSFRSAFKRRRCVVLANGYYEWKRVGAKKVPYRIASGSVMMMPGVWDIWTSPDGEVVESATIITREARPPVSALHDREPVVFATREEAYRFIDPRQTDTEALRALLRRDAPELSLYEANPLLNRVGNDGPECLVPAAS
jgi:hypothetical protein